MAELSVSLWHDYIGSTGFVELHDFSEGNLSEENRVAVVSKVASVCYGNEGLTPNFKLYDKLARESIGLPSSSFEFVPVLLTPEKIDYLEKKANGRLLPVFRFGEVFTYDHVQYVITNLRALLYSLTDIGDVSKIKDTFWYNTEEEATIIRKVRAFRVFRIKATIRDMRQFMRHRTVSYQELSRRYTTHRKVPIEYRLHPDLAEFEPLVQDSIKQYKSHIESGVKAENARDILPVSIYTTVWVAFYPEAFGNFIELRTKSSAQKEIRDIASAMLDLEKVLNEKSFKEQ